MLVQKTNINVDCRYDSRILVYEENGNTMVKVYDQNIEVLLDMSTATAKKLQNALVKRFGA